jgi:hypothetical protein
MRGALKLAVLVGLLGTSLSGCVGYYQSKSSAPVDKDLTLALLVVPEAERNQWAEKEVKFFNDERALSEAYLEKRKHIEDKEIKIYNDKVSWCGRTIWALLPIPLWSPACRTYTEITLVNGLPVSAREQYLQGRGYLCGPFVPFLSISKEPLPDGFCGDVE